MKKIKTELNEVFIINLENLTANAYRNMNRYKVDKLFYKAEKTLKLSLRERDKKKKVILINTSKYYNSKARKIWREILTISNKIT